LAIFILAKTKEGKIFEFELNGKVLIGRSSACSVTISEDGMMSGKHGIFEVGANGQVNYTDSGSKHGSWINGVKVSNTILKVNEVLKLGNTLFSIIKSKLTASELLQMSNSDTNLVNIEDKTLLIENSSLISRAKFERNEIDKIPNLAERLADGFDFIESMQTQSEVVQLSKESSESEEVKSDKLKTVIIRPSKMNNFFNDLSLKLDFKKTKKNPKKN
jgi:pSer/pThr/pTyr-binding forkhead associated (FHA) protein